MDASDALFIGLKKAKCCDNCYYSVQLESEYDETTYEIHCIRAIYGITPDSMNHEMAIRVREGWLCKWFTTEPKTGGR